MHIEWKILPKDDDVVPHWSAVYVSLNREGTIVINKIAYRRMGEPAAFLIMFDRVNNRIALKPTAAAMKHAYRARTYGHHGSRRVRAYRLLTDFGIKVDETLEFKNAEIDQDGQLFLDLRTARVSARAQAQSRKYIKR
jgi:hypothetical protein